MNFFKRAATATATATAVTLTMATGASACGLYATFNNDSIPNALASNPVNMQRIMQAANPSSQSFCRNIAREFADALEGQGLVSLRWSDKANNAPVPNRPGTNDDPFPRGATTNNRAPGEFAFYVKGPSRALRGAAYTDGQSYYFGQSVNEVAVQGRAPSTMTAFRIR